VKRSESVRITDESRLSGVGTVAVRPRLSGGVAARIAARLGLRPTAFKIVWKTGAACLGPGLLRCQAACE